MVVVPVTVLVAPTNGAPVVSTTAGIPSAGTGATVVTPNATDPDNDTLTISIVSGPAHGTVTDNGDGTFTYTPTTVARHAAMTPSAPKVDTFVLSVDDGYGGSRTQTVTVAISPQNTAATGTAHPAGPGANGVVTGTLTTSDADGDTLTFSAPAQTTKGTVSINPNTGQFTYTPTAAARHAAAANGATTAETTDTFTITINDGHSGVTTIPVTVTVGGANAAPTATANAGTPNSATTTVTGSVAASDADGDTLTFTTVTSPTNGTVTVNPNTGTFTYTPSDAASHALTAPPGPTGILIGSGLQYTTLTDPATVAQGTYTRPGGSGSYPYIAITFTATASQLYRFGQTAAPVDTYMSLYSGAFNPASPLTNRIAFNDDATIGEHAAAGATPQSCGSSSNCPQVSANLTAGQQVTIVLTTFSSGQSLPLPQTIYSNGPGNIPTGAAAPPPSTDSFTIRVSDGHGGMVNVPVTVTIGARNTAPTGSAIPGVPNSGTGVVTGTVTGNDADGDTLSFSTPATSAKGGTVTINGATGVFTYTPTITARHNAAAVGADATLTTDTINVTLNDGHGGTTVVPVTVAVEPANTLPTGVTTAGTPNATTGVVTGSVTGSDADSDTLSYSTSGTSAKGGTVTIDATTGAFTYTPTATARHDAAAVGADATLTTDTINVTLNDGHGGTTVVPVTVAVAPTNTNPTATVSKGSTFINGDFTSNLTGWTVINSRVKMDGSTIVAGWPTPTDPTTASDHGIEASTATGTYTTTVTNGRAVMNSNFPTTPGVANTPLANFTGSISGTTLTVTNVANGTIQVGQYQKLTGSSYSTARQITGQLSGTPGGAGTYSLSGASTSVASTAMQAGSGGVVHGPVVVSDNPVFIRSGATVQFDWEASGGSDAFDVIAYMLNVDTGDTYIMLNATGLSASTVQPITVVNFPVTQEGNYKFVFASGTWDATRGYAAGAKLSIDNVKVLNNGVVGAINGRVTGTDLDRDTLTYAVTTGPTAGSVTIDAATGAFSYIPTTSGASDSFVVTISDGHGGTVTVPVTI